MRLKLILTALILVPLLFIIAEILIIKFNGTPVPAPRLSRASTMLGQGSPLNYVVMGDSTSVGQGTDYTNSYSLASARHLAQKYKVNFVNFGVSGARVKDILDQQLPEALAQQPDIVLIAVGANDATHFTGSSSIQQDMTQIAQKLRRQNPNLKIVLTGSPAMDSVPRFPWPVKQLMGLRTRQVNKAFVPVIQNNNLLLAPIAQETRAAFLKDPTLFAPDKFHPNAQGYALWTPVINRALDQALAQK